MNTISECNEMVKPQANDPELMDYICKCGYTCPQCKSQLCAGEYLIDVSTKQAIPTTDIQGDLYGDQSMSVCPHCQLSIWSSMECGDWL